MPQTVAELVAKLSADVDDALFEFREMNKTLESIEDSSWEVAKAIDHLAGKMDSAAKKSVSAWKQLADNLDNLGSRIKGLGTTLSISVTAPLIALGKTAFDTSVRFNSLDRGLTAVMGSSTKAREEFEKLKEVAKLPGLGLEEAAKGSIQLQAAGMSANEARRSLMAFGNALATVGKSKDDLNGVNLALSQIATKGKVLGQDIRQLQERVPQIRKIMLDAFGTADTEVLQKAEVASKDFINIIVNELSKLPKVTGGVQNEIENLSDRWKLALKAMGDALIPFFLMFVERVTPAILSFTDALNKMSPAQKDLIVWAGLAVAALGPLTFAFGSLMTGISSTINLIRAFGPVLEKFALGPIGIVAGAVVSLALAWKYNWGGMRDVINNIVKEITDSVKELGDFFNVDFRVDMTNLRIFWETFWTGIAVVVTAVFGTIKTGLTLIIQALIMTVKGGMEVIRGHWGSAWETIKNGTKNTLDSLKTNVGDTISNLQTQFKSYYDKMVTIVDEGQNKLRQKLNNPLAMGKSNMPMLSSHGSPLDAIATKNATALPFLPGPGGHNKEEPFSLSDSINLGLAQVQNKYRNKVREILNTPKKKKLTEEQRQEIAFTKELRDAQKELNALRNGSSKQMADELGQYNLLNPAKVRELGILKEQITLEKERIQQREQAARKAKQDLLDEARRFHEVVKAEEARRRDLLKGNTRENVIQEEFPHQKKDMRDYFNQLKLSNDQLERSQKENKRFKEELKGVRAEIESIISGDGLAKLRQEYKGLVTDNDLRKLNDANAQVKSLNLLATAMDKLTLVRMPKAEREAATAVGIELWKEMTEEGKKRVIGIFEEIHANEELVKSIEKANEAAQKRLDTLKDFSDTMQGRIAAAQANLAGDNAMGAWQRYLVSNDKLRDAIGVGPTLEAANAMNQFFTMFDAEKRTKDILDTVEALKDFNTEMSQSIKLARLELTGGKETLEFAWQKFLLQNSKLAEKFRLDMKMNNEAFSKFRELFNLEKQISNLEKVQEKIKDLRDTLQDVFSDAILNLKNGFGSFFSSIIQGFEKMLQEMAAKWIASQIVNLVMRLIGNFIGASVGGGNTLSFVGAAAGTAAGSVSNSPGYIGNVDTEANVSASSFMRQGGTVINMQVVTPDANSFKQSSGQIMTDVKRRSDYYDTRNNSKWNRQR